MNAEERKNIHKSYGNDKTQLVCRAKELMKQVGINGLEQRSITEVSGGQLQRTESVLQETLPGKTKNEHTLINRAQMFTKE